MLPLFPENYSWTTHGVHQTHGWDPSRCHGGGGVNSGLGHVHCGAVILLLAGLDRTRALHSHQHTGQAPTGLDVRTKSYHWGIAHMCAHTHTHPRKSTDRACVCCARKHTRHIKADQAKSKIRPPKNLGPLLARYWRW